MRQSRLELVEFFLTAYPQELVPPLLTTFKWTLLCTGAPANAMSLDMDRLLKLLIEFVSSSFGALTDSVRTAVIAPFINDPSYRSGLLVGIATVGVIAFLMRQLLYWHVMMQQRDRNKRHLDELRKGHDPYVVGAAIEEPGKFYGRQETLTELIRALEASNHMVIYGERRIGKTSLLHQLDHRLSQGNAFIPIFFEMQGMSEERFFRELMRAAARAVRERAETGPLLIDGDPARYDNLDMGRDLDTIFDILDDKGIPASIVFLLDEADTLNNYDPHTQERLRGLLMSTRGRVKLVWSGQRLDRTWRLDTSPWYNLFRRWIKLEGLDVASAERLIREPVKGIYEYDDEAVERILKYSDYRPHKIQGLCSACMRRLRNTQRDRVTADDVEAAYQEWLAEDMPESVPPSAAADYQVSSPAHQVAEKRADYTKGDTQ